ncbi:MAG: CoB--CoM heterodisulfide reductase iron-sulfur subunit B family protein [Desulfopila sp.]|jgi:heterodisulfide reductase subunit B|nr:CoB--CoM heterodisulfide reductase iron-sulfur subunit B family protein [Desulfopila sp.]
MRYAFFQGCNIPVRIEQYAIATQAVFQKFDLELVEVRDFNCCGYPVRNVDEKSYILPSVRNLAIAEKMNLDIVVICNCCFASLMKAKSVLDKNGSLQNEINHILAKEGLQYTGKALVRHYLSVLYNDVGIEKITKKLVYKVKNLGIAVIQGCHILRPREILHFDNSFVPKITDALVQCTGAENLDWRGKLECCGAALAGINDPLCHDLLTEKILGARQAGAQFITPICSYCYLQFDTTQQIISPHQEDILPVLLYPQLLGMCLGISEKELGLEKNRTIGPQDIEKITSSLGSPEEDRKKRKKKIKQPA